MYFTSDEEKIDATLTQVVAAHVDEKLHVGVPEECGLALGARLVLHFGKRRETLTTSQVSKLSPVSRPGDFVFVLIFWGFSALNVLGGLR